MISLHLNKIVNMTWWQAEPTRRNANKNPKNKIISSSSLITTSFIILLLVGIYLIPTGLTLDVSIKHPVVQIQSNNNSKPEPEHRQIEDESGIDLINKIEISINDSGISFETPKIEGLTTASPPPSPTPLVKKQLELIHDHAITKPSYFNRKPVLSENDLDSIMKEYYVKRLQSKWLSNYNRDVPWKNYYYNNYNNFKANKPYNQSPIDDDYYYQPELQSEEEQYKSFYPYNFPLIHLESEQQQQKQQNHYSGNSALIKEEGKMKQLINNLKNTNPIKNNNINNNKIIPDDYNHNDIFIDGYIRPSNYSSMVLRMHQYGDGYLKCRKCGGYTSESHGECCLACGQLKYDGCWCKPCDCLCYMKNERPIRWAGQLRSLM